MKITLSARGPSLDDKIWRLMTVHALLRTSIKDVHHYVSPLATVARTRPEAQLDDQILLAD